MAGNEFEFEDGPDERFDLTPETAVPAAGGRIWGDPAVEARKEARRLFWERVVCVIVIALMGFAVVLIMRNGGWSYVTGNGQKDAKSSSEVGSGVGTGGSAEPAARVLAPSAAEVAARPDACAGYVSLAIAGGPTAQTGELVQVLQAWGVPATFFFTGEHMAGEWGREGVRVVRAQGSVIGNHTWSHERLDRIGLGQEGVGGRDPATELGETEAEYSRLTDGGKLGLWMPPYGALSGAAVAAGELAGEHLVLWTQDPRDWRFDGPVRGGEGGEGGDARVREVVAGSQGVSAGGILLLHDGHPVTVAALGKIIRSLWDRDLCLGRIQAGPEVPEAELAGAPGVRFRARSVAE
jgi:peptidoglycan/xylan/chitin deacetylase (PgdA/CDA1 family)